MRHPQILELGTGMTDYAPYFPWIDLSDHGIRTLSKTIFLEADEEDAQGCFLIPFFKEETRDQEISFFPGNNASRRSYPWIEICFMDRIFEALQTQAENLRASGCFLARDARLESGRKQRLFALFGTVWSPDKVLTMNRTDTSPVGKFDYNTVSPPFQILQKSSGTFALQNFRD